MLPDDPLTDDTSPRARAAQVAALRRMGPDRRLSAGLRFSNSMIALSRSSLRSRNPLEDERTLTVRWLEQCYGPDLARAVAERLGEPAWTIART